MDRISKQYDLIAKATAFFEAQDKLARHTGYAISSGSWFTCECRHSVHRESIFGYEPTYDRD
jgi:hypothetical protein